MPRGKAIRSIRNQAGLQFAAILAVVFCAGPVALIVLGSFRKVSTLGELAPSTSGWTLSNYTTLFSTQYMGRWILNSLIVCAAVTCVMITLDALAAYAFAKLHFFGRKALFVMLVSTMMLPFSITLIPTYVLAARYGLTDNYFGLIFPPLAAPLGVYLLRQFISAIPDELLEAARIDGASNFTIFARVVAPLCGQPVAVLSVLTFVANWNSFIWPLLITQSDSMKTLTVGIATANVQFSANLGGISTEAVISMAPMALLFFAFQRYFIKGVVAGAVKA